MIHDIANGSSRSGFGHPTCGGGRDRRSDNQAGAAAFFQASEEDAK